MIRILVSNGELALYKDTSMNFEYNNALFASEAIEGDIVYSFDIPVKGNEIALGFGHDPKSAVNEKFPCSVVVNGVNVVSGELVVQQAETNRMTVAVICNPYPEGYKDRSIRDNDSDAVTVATSAATHQTEWKLFLKNTLTDDRIKFGPFINREGYGDTELSDFGYFGGYNRGKIANRVLYDGMNDVVESSANPFIELFNQAVPLDGENGFYVERNQFILAPQVRLRHIFENCVANAGFGFINHCRGTDLDRIHIQSPAALDGNGAQYNVTTSYYLLASRAANVSGVLSPETDPQMLMRPGLYPGIRFQASGWYRVQGNITIPKAYQVKGKVYFIAAQWIPVSSSSVPLNPQYKIAEVELGYHNAATQEDFSYDGYIYVANSLAGVSMSIGFYIDYNNTNTITWIAGGLETLEVSSVAVDTASGDNIFAREFHMADLFPNVTNADFIRGMIQSLGLAYYIDSRKGMVEIVPFTDIKDCRSIDLSDIVLTRETVVENPEDGRRIFRVSSMSDASETDDELTPVQTVAQLPDPYLSIGKRCLVKEMNAYYKPEKVESGQLNWEMEWVNQENNLQQSVIGGEGEGKVFKSAALVPSHDTEGEYTLPIPNIPNKLYSSLLEADGEISDKIVMLYLRGMRPLGNSSYRYVEMLPYKSGLFSLTADGSDSLCSNYTDEWRKIVDLSKKITYKLRIPIVKAVEILRLIQPQTETPSEQTRWIVVDNVRSMPVKISMQVDNTDGLVLCELECAKAV